MFRKSALAAALLAALAAPAAAQEREAEGRGWMGISFQWPEGQRERATVQAVYPESPARRAGVERGDVILRIDGRAATEGAVDDLRERLEPGDTVRLRVLRAGREQERLVVAAARPGPREILGFGGEWPGGREIVVHLDSMGVRLDSMGVHLDSAFRKMRGMRVEIDSGGVFRMDGPEGRAVILRMHTDSMRARVDTLMKRMDSLRIRIRGSEPIERGEVVLRFDSAFRDLPPGALREFRRELPRVEMLGPDDELPFVMELGRRALAGAEFAEMNEGLARYFGNAREGLLVLQVSPSTPAGRAGLEAGDVVVRAGGAAVRSVRDLREAVRRDEDDRIPLEVIRQGRRREVTLEWEDTAFPFRTEIRREVVRPSRGTE